MRIWTAVKVIRNNEKYIGNGHFFSFRVVNLWNNLPSDVVSAPSVNAFKERLDKHWKEYCFTLDPEDFIRR